MTALNDFFLIVLGPDGQPKDMTVLQISLRCILIFAIGLALAGIGDRRSLSQKTGFDALLSSCSARHFRVPSTARDRLETVGPGVALMVYSSLVSLRSLVARLRRIDQGPRRYSRPR